MRTVGRFLQWFAFLLVALVIVVFMIGNRQPVEVDLWPLPFTKPAPLFAVIIACVLFGFLIGVLSAWLSGASARRKARDMTRLNAEKAQQISQLQREVATLKDSGQQPRPPSITHAA
jgi:lipopolysaccharide assembly protein A